MEISLKAFTAWADARVGTTPDAEFTGTENVKADDFLSRIRQDCGVTRDAELPACIRASIDAAGGVAGKPLTARTIKMVSDAAIGWERELNRLGNLVADSGLSEAAVARNLDRLQSLKTADQLKSFEADLNREIAGAKDVPTLVQSPGANTCFAMSVLNGCLRSPALGDRARTLIGDWSKSSPQQYVTAQGNLGHLESNIVNYMGQHDDDYKVLLAKRSSVDMPLPLGNAIGFAKALELEQTQDDVMFVLADDFLKMPGKSKTIKSYDEVKRMIADQLSRGGVVTMNRDNCHYVAITKIEGDEVTVIDSRKVGGTSGKFDLRTFVSELPSQNDMSGKRCCVFSFLGLKS